MKRDGPSGEGGYPCGRPSASSAPYGTTNSSPGEVKRRNRWTQDRLVGSTAPSPSSPSNHGDFGGAAEAPVPQGTSQRRPQGPLAVKSKAAKPASDQQRGVPEQGLLNALHARLQTPSATSPGLLSMVPARPAATGAADPQMPAPSTDDPGTGTHAPAGTAATTKEKYLQEEEEQSGPVDTEIALLAEQRAMRVVHRYQTLSVKTSANAGAQSAKAPEVLPPVAPPVSLYANLPHWHALVSSCVTLGCYSGLPSIVDLPSLVFEGSTSANCHGK